jgi:GNAT superfamily N-acetyltransferase
MAAQRNLDCDSVSSNVLIRLLNASDIPRCMELKQQAGWNQTVDDWARLLELAPNGCFGIECDGVLAATTTAICYGRELAWIGMVLTDAAFRRRGFASRLMQHALDFLDSRGIACVKLDATAMGQPVYRRFGFEIECAIERWVCQASFVEAPRVTSYRYEPTLGDDRNALLESLARVDAASVPGAAFAMCRPGSQMSYFGPCLSWTAAAARDLACWCLARHAGEPVCWDLLPDNADAVAIARNLGFARQRELVRMRRGSAMPTSRRVFAIAGFEFG